MTYLLTRFRITLFTVSNGFTAFAALVDNKITRNLSFLYLGHSPISMNRILLKEPDRYFTSQAHCHARLPGLYRLTETPDAKVLC